ncbi:MAG: hypothetical protein PHE93_05110 [Clostridia bacterium]|nr:hypothetical protein [Clostridia bacterium]
MKNLGISDWIALGAVTISVVSIVLSIITNTKNYELTCQQRKEILDWYNNVINALIALKLNLTLNNDYDKIDYLIELSSLVELGRFYFPNVIKDKYGNEKPLAYQGYRDMSLEYLIWFYDICMRDDCKNYLKHLEKLQREFTSKIFETIKPYKHIKKIQRYTSISLNQKTINDYLSSNPDSFFNS